MTPLVKSIHEQHIFSTATIVLQTLSHYNLIYPELFSILGLDRSCSELVVENRGIVTNISVYFCCAKHAKCGSAAISFFSFQIAQQVLLRNESSSSYTSLNNEYVTVIRFSIKFGFNLKQVSFMWDRRPIFFEYSQSTNNESLVLNKVS